MEDLTNVQKRFFHELKCKLPSNLSLANVVADELSISIDSAYRRIRCESDLSLSEFDILATKYGVSSESVLSNKLNGINFNYRSISHDEFSFESYFNSITQEIQSLEKFGLKEIIYAALDLPLFYYFMFSKLAAFKLFFLRRNVFYFPGTGREKFNVNLIDQGELDKSYKMLKSYLEVPTIEIWSEETLNSTLRQILYYQEIGLFEHKQDIIDILNDVTKVIEHVEKQAENGSKFYPAQFDSANKQNKNFSIYYNEVTISENVILLKLENFNVVHLGHNVLNILSTTNETFYQDAYRFIEKVIKNSTLISVTSEKERKRFFNILYNKIDTTIANL
jgi:hypothetical protein